MEPMRDWSPATVLVFLSPPRNVPPHTTASDSHKRITPSPGRTAATAVTVPCLRAGTFVARAPLPPLHERPLPIQAPVSQPRRRESRAQEPGQNPPEPE